jgi:enoyl-CoA hydratase
MSAETLRVEAEGEHVLVVTLDRPEALNAIDTRMGRELLEVWTRLAEPGAVRCVVLTGAGERAFCAGADLKERDGLSDDDWHIQHELFERGFLALARCPVPVLAAVGGHAFGGGLELALLCDFVYAAAGVRLGLPEVTRGIIPGGGGTQTLARAVGERRAKELILTGRAFTAEEGHAFGLVNRLCAPGTTLAATLATAQEIAANAPLAVRQAKRAIAAGRHLDHEAAYRAELEAYAPLVPTDDRREGVRAFNERRPPRFRGV